MTFKILWPIRYETTSQGTNMWYVSLDTSLYTNKTQIWELNTETRQMEASFNRTNFKISVLGFGIRITR